MRPPAFDVIEGDVRDVLSRVDPGSVQTCVTSPPYFGLRDYGNPRQIGLERSLGEYIDRLVAVFDEVRRVLRDDGTLWLNLGDSYATRWASVRDVGGRGLNGGSRSRTGQTRVGLKEKDLMGVPWRVAFALQDAGWWLRKEVVWDKPNPTPEAVRDRPTSSHESIFLLAKSPDYFYDVDGFREPFADARMGRDGSKRASERNRGGRTDGLTKPNGIDPSANGGRQARDVWRIPTVPFPGAHFAVFPPEVPRRCILLGSGPRACARCGAPYRRMVERQRLLDGQPVAGSWSDGERKFAAQGVGHHRFTSEGRTLGWRPTCACGAPAGVLDDDLEEIESPTAEGAEDPTLEVGRKGLARPREGGGTRSLTRYEQRHYARQLAGSAHREAMEAEVGADTFAHYLRTDRSGARPPRPSALAAWLERGWLEQVEPPAPWWEGFEQGRCRVLDPFAGAGTAGLVAVDEGRDFTGIELNAEYAAMADERIRARLRSPRLEFLAEH